MLSLFLDRRIISHDIIYVEQIEREETVDRFYLLTKLESVHRQILSCSELAIYVSSVILDRFYLSILLVERFYFLIKTGPNIAK